MQRAGLSPRRQVQPHLLAKAGPILGARRLRGATRSPGWVTAAAAAAGGKQATACAAFAAACPAAPAQLSKKAHNSKDRDRARLPAPPPTHTRHSPWPLQPGAAPQECPHPPSSRCSSPADPPRRRGTCRPQGAAVRATCKGVKGSGRWWDAAGAGGRVHVARAPRLLCACSAQRCAPHTHPKQPTLTGRSR